MREHVAAIATSLICLPNGKKCNESPPTALYDLPTRRTALRIATNADKGCSRARAR